MYVYGHVRVCVTRDKVEGKGECGGEPLRKTGGGGGRGCQKKEKNVTSGSWSRSGACGTQTVLVFKASIRMSRSN